MPKTNERIHICLPATHTTGTHITGLLEALCRETQMTYQLSESFTFQIVSAFQEAYNNMIIHAYSGEEGHPSEIFVVLDEGSISITLFDEGEPIGNQNPIVELIDFGMIAPDALPEGGMGMSIMHSCMDLVRHGRIEERNQVKMTKYFESEKPFA